MGVPLLSASPFATHLTLDEVVRDLEHLPSAPRVLPRLKQLLCDGNTAMTEVVEMVRLDPGIAARVLQFGNSAYFSHGLRCYTVEEAVGRVGYEQIYELVATAVASQVLVRPLCTYGMEADDLWQNSVACALAAEALADRLRADRNVAYTIGLLHSLGMVAIDDWASRRQPSLRLLSKGLPLEACEEERATLGFHQGEAGAALLRLWAFPPVMAEPVRWQYLPGGTSAHFQLAALLHAAKWIRTVVLHPADQPPAPPPALLGKLGLTLPQLEKLCDEVSVRLRLINRQLDVEVRSISLNFPGGERTIRQSGFRQAG
jgi:HD-like signal output (HDOD) protein